MLRSPWLGVLAITVAGIIGYVMSDGHAVGTRRLESVTATIRATRDTGAGWDFGGGAPDPKIVVTQGDATLATCEAKDTLTPTCAVHAVLDGSPVRVSVVDVDTSDSDAIGELVLDLREPTTTGSGALQAVAVHQRGSGGGGAWQRFRPLWIALAVGIAIAAALRAHRRRRA